MPVDFTIKGSIKKNTISKSFSSFFSYPRGLQYVYNYMTTVCFTGAR